MEDKEIIDLYWQRSDRAIAETDRKYGRRCWATPGRRPGKGAGSCGGRCCWRR